MIFYDYLPSQNGWKVRPLLQLLAIPHQVRYVGIFAREGQSPDYLRINPWGAVSAIALDDGRVLSESNAILWLLGAGSTPARPTNSRPPKSPQWMSFEADYVQATMGSLRH